jgi:hypothetical protein
LTFASSRWQVLGIILGALLGLAAVVFGFAPVLERRRVQLGPARLWHPAVAGSVGVASASLLIGLPGLLAGAAAIAVRRLGALPAAALIALIVAGIAAAFGLPVLLSDALAVFGFAAAVIAALSGPRER